MMKDDSTTQSLIESIITDTAFRINGERLQCPRCTDTPELNLEHILINCDQLTEERTESYLYTKKAKGNTTDYVKTDLLPIFCKVAKNKIINILQEARHKFLQENNLVE